jgi:hypothetical protein
MRPRWRRALFPLDTLLSFFWTIMPEEAKEIRNICIPILWNMVLGALVGQDGILRPIGNRPTAASIRPAGGLATRYRMRIWPNIRRSDPVFSGIGV